MLKIINKGAKSDLPFSPAIQVGDLVYISGQASVDHNTGKIISGTIEEQIDRSMNNVNNILNSINLSLGNSKRLTSSNLVSLSSTVMAKHIVSPIFSPCASSIPLLHLAQW